MNRPVSVVPVQPPVGEGDFHNAMVAGLARAQAALGGQRALAFVMDLSRKQVGNIMAGASTDPKRLWDVQAAVPGTLDDVAALYGCRVVSAADEPCATAGKLSVAFCAVLSKSLACELDGVVDHSELLAMEPELREARHLIDACFERIAALRRPTVVTGGGPGP